MCPSPALKAVKLIIQSFRQHSSSEVTFRLIAWETESGRLFKPREFATFDALVDALVSVNPAFSKRFRTFSGQPGPEIIFNEIVLLSDEEIERLGLEPRSHERGNNEGIA